MAKDLATKDLTKRLTKLISYFFIGVIIFAFVIVATLLIQRVSLFSISGNSMEPTLTNKQSVVLKQLDTVDKDQIVFFSKPSAWNEYVDHDAILVKRISAVPGDTLEFDGKAFKVNGEISYELTEDDYECKLGDTDYKHTLLGTELYATGDNANHSLDSRRIFCDGNADDMYIPKRNIVDHGEIVVKF